MDLMPRALSLRLRAWDLAREFALPLAALLAIVATADLRIPIGLPGHRGLLWLTLLVAVALTARRTGTLSAVGVGSSALALALGTAAAPGALRYVAAAILLEAVAAAPLARRRPWVVALAAAPIHLVALVVPMGAGFGLATMGSLPRLLGHLGFGLVAGMLGWAFAAGAERVTRR
ncbi:hypothetical protein ACFQE5_04385 [Pseudonocardia hispaniensis]|uniref:Rod shape-determining protein MreD n=1 Tax=Pseudonocardia hispaniensis TaxID=904933 RepID=A0ABW1IYI3_9PSEU